MRSSPRASMGLSMLPASMAPSEPPPAPTMVCSSSMKVITSPSEFLISLSTALRRSSNSPRYLAPATMEDRSREIRRLLRSDSGTSPATIRWARPSTTAVLPTPGSPISTGLFLVRRDSTCTTRRISLSRPITGSSLPARAASVRSVPYFFRASKVPSGLALVTRCPPRTVGRISRRAWAVAPASRRARAAASSPSAMAISMCSVEMYSSVSSLASLSAFSRAARKPREGLGSTTELPAEEGREVSAVRVAAPTFFRVCGLSAFSSPTATPPSWLSSSPSRWSASTWGLPAAAAACTAPDMASWDLVV